MSFQRHIVVLLLVVFVVVVSTGKPKRRKDKQSDEVIQKLETRIEALEQHFESGHDSDGSCSGNNVHFFFHGDSGHGHEHDHDDDDTHVHVDLHLNDHGRHDHGDDHFHHEHVAICKMDDISASGTVTIVQGDHDRAASFSFNFGNLGVADSTHNFHVHQFGDISDNCDHVGGHYDPYHKDVDVGDLGTIMSDGDSAVVDAWKNDTHLSLFGEYSIVGRSVMVHDSDGKAMSCCVISWSPDTHDHEMNHSHDHSTHAHDHSAHAHDHSAHAHAHSAHSHDHH